MRARLDAVRHPALLHVNPLIFLHDVMLKEDEPMPLRVRCAELLSAKLMPDLKAIDMQMDAEVESRGLSADAVIMLRRILMGS